jgi:general secretion pathway protein J
MRIGFSLRQPGHQQQAGFTLIEVLVALFVMSVMAMLSWRGIDSMARNQSQLSERASQLHLFNATLGQWRHDLDAMIHTDGIEPWIWDGKTLRLSRLGLQTPGFPSGVVVVAWTLRDSPSIPGESQLERWQSPPVTTLDGWAKAWNMAEMWGQINPPELKNGAHRLQPASKFQVYIFRDKSWTNPFSSNDASASQLGVIPGARKNQRPAGIRLVIAPTRVSGLAGDVTLDWASASLRMAP